MFDVHTATYVGTYTLALHSHSPGPSPSPVPVQALSEWAIRNVVIFRLILNIKYNKTRMILSIVSRPFMNDINGIHVILSNIITARVA